MDPLQHEAPLLPLPGPAAPRSGPGSAHRTVPISSAYRCISSRALSSCSSRCSSSIFFLSASYFCSAFHTFSTLRRVWGCQLFFRFCKERGTRHRAPYRRPRAFSHRAGPQRQARPRREQLERTAPASEPSPGSQRPGGNPRSPPHPGPHLTKSPPPMAARLLLGYWARCASPT